MPKTGINSDDVRKKAIASRKQTSARINHKTITNDDKKPSQVPNRGIAIQNFCRYCFGFDATGSGSMAKLIESCDNYKCWLWNWRTGKLTIPVGIPDEED